MKDPLLSHPDTLLIDHLTEVADVAVETVRRGDFDFSLVFDDQKVDLTQLLPDLMHLTAIFHDLGKATPFFQEYIRNPEKISDQRKSHALLSALFVFFTVRKFLNELQFSEDLKHLICSFCFLAVKRHHGNLGNLKDELFFEDFQDLLIEQAESIDEDQISQIIKKSLKNFKFEIEWSDFLLFIRQKDYDELFDGFVFDFLENELTEWEESIKLSLYYFFQVLYSSLLFADKYEVILKDKIPTLVKADVCNKIEEYREKKGFNFADTEINSLKNKAFFESLDNLEKVFEKNRNIYSVTLPTGMGKTITSYMLADKLRELAGIKNSKIIINIPFTSIIDQNFEVYSEILGTDDSNIILKHHHLAEPRYKTNENIADFDISKFLIETWQSDTIVTTFVQFLETLFNHDKTKLMKLSHLSGAVILLDEIQTIPYELWETVRKGFQILGKRYNIYFILISATQPLIFTPGKDITELVPDYKSYFRFFNRTKLIINNKTVSFERFKEIISDYLLNNPKKDILIILNTKSTAKSLFEFIRDGTDVDDKEFYYLTTLITPYERKEIIKRIKQRSGKQKIIVSTQLIEAGVDISVDTVFRQLAPVDSIIQSAGRANRYSENNKPSEVFLFDIEEFRKAGNRIYGNDLLIKTENVLKDFSRIEEKNFLQLIEKYFIEVRKQSDNTTNELLKAIEDFDFGNVDLKVIKDRKTESVFVQLNEFAKSIWDKYVDICSKDLKLWEKEALFSKIKSDFYDFVINVPVPWDREHIIFDSEKEYGFYVSHLEHPSINYKYAQGDFTQNTGYDDLEMSSFFL